MNLVSGVYSRDNLSKIKDGAYIINLDEYSDIGTHWVALWVNNNNVTYFINRPSFLASRNKYFQDTSM